MPTCEIVDTFPSFLNVWNETQYEAIDVQIDAWLEGYMLSYPELLQKQLDDYASQQEDWRTVAAERIFPRLPERLPAMQTAHDNLMKIYAHIYERSEQTLQFNKDLVCVIYVGVGCGAGWASDYDGKAAILFGLENIAEEGWQERDTLEGLMAHELGHLGHFEWREQASVMDEESPWWQLYTEGFAQHCESLILGRPSWHMQSTPEDQWQKWCADNLEWLATEFLRRVDNDEDLRPFFGSWFNLGGQKQTGYFLGRELIKTLLEQMSLQEVALLTDLASYLRPLLVKLAG